MFKKHCAVLICLAITALMPVAGCSGGSSQTSASPGQTASAAQSQEPSGSTSPDDANVPVLNMQGAGNTPSNLLSGGMAAQYEGYSYHVDRMYSGNLWRTSIATGQSELIVQGTFGYINVNAGYIFAIGDVKDEEGNTSSGIYMISADGSALWQIKEGYFSNLILYDNYLYFHDSMDSSLHRIKYDGTDIKMLYSGPYQEFTIIGGYAYLYDMSGGTSNIVKMPLDGSSAPAAVVKDVFGTFYAAEDRIFYISREDTTSITHCYDTKTGQSSAFANLWMYHVNSDGEYLYYYWSGVRQDNADQGLYRCNMDGSDANLLIQGEMFADISLSGGKLIWMNNDEQRRLSICNLDGSGQGFFQQGPSSSSY